MRVITLNINGIRAGRKKGFFEWLTAMDADFVCLQEIKAQEDQLTDAIFHPEDYHCLFNSAEKKGYSGVALYSRHKPQQIVKTLGWPCADTEGRYLQIDIGKLSIVSLYLPSGTSGDERQAVKYDFLNRFEAHLSDLIGLQRQVIIAGDWNIAHKKIDLKNWRGNQKHSGFLPEERAWMDQLFNEMHYADAFRIVNQEPDQYTWWSNRGQAWAKNVGWRIDYQVISENLKDKVTNVAIYKEQRFSDHAPLIIDYDLEI